MDDARRRAVLVLTGLLTAALAAASMVPAGPAAAVLRYRTVGAPVGVTSGIVKVVGAGFGHGVGLSQYGAYGMAKAGKSASEILTHYYSGTTVAGYPDDVDVSVNVVDRGTRVTFRTTALAAGGGGYHLISAAGGTLALDAGDTAEVTVGAGQLAVTVTRAGGTTSGFSTGSLVVRWSGARNLAGPASVMAVDSASANAGSTSTKSRRYRWGSLALSPVQRTDSDGAVRTRIEAVAVLNLHREYLRGIAEVPFSWPAAALQAQVIAARNYALVSRGRAVPSGCGGCLLWDDTRSQVYRGWDSESGYGADRWLAAVAATQTSSTRGLTVLYNGSPVTAYYSSSSGGRTRSAASVWGTSVAYLRSVPDPWSIDPTVNPGYARWTREVPVATLTALFGLPDLAAVAVTDRDAGGAALTVTATASDGTVHTVSGAALTSRLGLPAAWISAFELPTAPSAGTDAGTK
jgi:SpoIID/LytB domain protein